MSLKQQIADDMKSAMREKDTVRLEAVRMLRAAIQRKEVDDQTELDDAAVQEIAQKMVKQTAESIKQFTKGDRPDLVEKEQNSLQHIEMYLPAQLSGEEIDSFIQQAIETTCASAPCDMGKIMGWLKPKLKGQADMGKVSQLVKARLSGE